MTLETMREKIAELERQIHVLELLANSQSMVNVAMTEAVESLRAENRKLLELSKVQSHRITQLVNAFGGKPVNDSIPEEVYVNARALAGKE